MLQWLVLKAAFWGIGAAALAAVGVDSNEPIDLRFLQGEAQQSTVQAVELLNEPPTPLLATRTPASLPDPAPPVTGPAVGIATWYGGHSLLDGQRTAWGEIYDPDDPTTAAAALLPNAAGEWVVPLWGYNTRLRICHEDQCIVARITDTCPACLNPESPGGGEILLDLSRAAFQKLAPLTQGRLRVQITVLE